MTQDEEKAAFQAIGKAIQKEIERLIIAGDDAAVSRALEAGIAALPKPELHFSAPEPISRLRWDVYYQCHPCTGGYGYDCPYVVPTID